MRSGARRSQKNGMTYLYEHMRSAVSSDLVHLTALFKALSGRSPSPRLSGVPGFLLLSPPTPWPTIPLTAYQRINCGFLMLCLSARISLVQNVNRHATGS